MKIKNTKRKILFKFSFLAIFFLMTGLIFPVIKTQAATVDATLLFNDSVPTVASGADFNLIARVNPGSNISPGVNAVDFRFTFDASVLSVNSITVNAVAFTQLSAPVINNTDGTASVVVFTTTPVTVTTDIATISLHAISAAVNSSITITPESNAAVNDGNGTQVVATRTPSVVNITGADTVAPKVTAFDVPAAYNNLTVPITTFTATDAVGVSAYLVNESSTPPLAGDAGWGVKPTTYIFATIGSKTLYAWAKDAAGYVSASLSDTVTIDTTAPTITSVSSDKAAGSYKVGEVIDIDVTFSENITSTGNVTVTLETGTTDRTCTFTVSNASTGTCNYTVQAGDTSSDLEVNSISGTIADQAGNAMSNFVPTTNLAANEALVIDTTAPTITSVSSDKAAGSYKVGEVIDIDVTFSENITSTGNVTVTLETGTTDRTCTFTVSNASTGTCNYTVQAGDTSSDLEVNSISGTIADQAGNAMSNFVPTTNLAANEDVIIDTVMPIVGISAPANNAKTNDNTPTLTYTVSDGSVVVKVDDVIVAKTSGQSLDSLADGSHNVAVEATDTAGNVATVINTFIVDTVLPDTTISSQPSNPSSSVLATFDFSAEAGSTFQCKIDGGSYGSCVSPQSYSELSQGNHTFYVKATDAAGNIESVEASYVWTIDLPPVISSGSPWGKLRDGTRQVTMGVITSEDATCRYSPSSGVDFAGMTQFSTTGATSHSTLIGGLGDGKSYGLFVRCQDITGNTTSDYLVSFRIDKDDDDDDKKKKSKPRSISHSKKSIVRGATLIQRGKKFSKNDFVLLYFSKVGGGYYAPQKIKTSSNGAFTISYVVNKPKGSYSWYAVDVKTGKKSKTITYKVR